MLQCDDFAFGELIVAEQISRSDPSMTVYGACSEQQLIIEMSGFQLQRSSPFLNRRHITSAGVLAAVRSSQQGLRLSFLRALSVLLQSNKDGSLRQADHHIPVSDPMLTTVWSSTLMRRLTSFPVPSSSSLYSCRRCHQRGGYRGHNLLPRPARKFGHFPSAPRCQREALLSGARIDTATECLTQLRYGI